MTNVLKAFKGNYAVIIVIRSINDWFLFHNESGF